MRIEEFKPIPGYEYYHVSNLGRILSTKEGTVKIRKAGPDKNGYPRLYLYNEKGRKMFKVHRLVALVFLGHPGDKVVNHKNGIKTDNRIENLEYCTPSENNMHYYRVLGGKSNGGSKRRPIKCSNGEIYPSSREAARKLNMSHSNIRMCCNGKYKKCNGYSFEYA